MDFSVADSLEEVADHVSEAISGGAGGICPECGKGPFKRLDIHRQRAHGRLRKAAVNVASVSGSEERVSGKVAPAPEFPGVSDLESVPAPLPADLVADIGEAFDAQVELQGAMVVTLLLGVGRRLLEKSGRSLVVPAGWEAEAARVHALLIRAYVPEALTERQKLAAAVIGVWSQLVVSNLLLVADGSDGR